VPLVRYVCKLCKRRADGELEEFGLLCAGCCDRVLDQMYALLEVDEADRRALLSRLTPLTDEDPFAPEPVNWRKTTVRTRAERRREWKAKGLID
jgi:hypothetical protein